MRRRVLWFFLEQLKSHVNSSAARKLNKLSIMFLNVKLLLITQHGESVKVPSPTLSSLPPSSSREKGQVDDAICGLETGHKTAPLCAQKSSIITVPLHTNANEQRVPERCACCAICTARPMRTTWPSAVQKILARFFFFNYLFTLGSSGRTHWVL